MSKFVSVKKILKGGLFTPGTHATEISEATEITSHENKSWKGVTKQVKVVFRNADGVIAHSYSLQGFKKADLETNPDLKAEKGFAYRQALDKDGNGIGDHYLVNLKTNERVLDEENTATAQRIFGEMACDAGIPEGEDFELSDLVGRQVGVEVHERGTGVEVAYTMPYERAEKAALAS